MFKRALTKPDGRPLILYSRRPIDERIYVIEQNRDAQLLQLMKLELTPEHQTKLRSVLHYNGLPIDARSITDDVLAQEGFEVAKKTVARVSAGSAGGE